MSDGRVNIRCPRCGRQVSVIVNITALTPSNARFGATRISVSASGETTCPCGQVEVDGR